MTPEQLAAAQKAAEEAAALAELHKKMLEDLAKMAEINKQAQNGKG